MFGDQIHPSHIDIGVLVGALGAVIWQQVSSDPIGSATLTIALLTAMGRFAIMSRDWWRGRK
jgi:hypothetical protein